MKRYLLILSLMLILGATSIYSQDNIIYRQQHLHEVFANPASAGTDLFPVATLSYQKQWLGIPESPYILMAGASYRIGSYDFYNPKMMVNTSDFGSRERVGLGLGIYADQNGPVSHRGLNVAYAYHLPLDRNQLSMGISISVEQNSLNGNNWDPIQNGDPLLDPVRDNHFHFNANAGILYTTRKYSAGFAVNHILPLKNKQEANTKIKQDFLLHGSYQLNVDDKVSVEPIVMLRFLDYDSFEYDIMMKAYLEHLHWLALSYRSYKAINLSLGLRISRDLYLAYQFEVNLSSIIRYNGGTHGIHLGLNLGRAALY